MLGPRDAELDQILRHGLLEMRQPSIQVDDDAGRILQLLTLLHKPAFVVEIGSLFGYSTVHIARGLPPGGRIVGLEIDAAAAHLARLGITMAGLSDKAQIVHGDALDYIPALADGSVDMVFIDGDKKAYPDYLKAIVRKVRSGGLIIADDAFADSDFTEGGHDDNDAQQRGIQRYAKAMGKTTNFFSAFVATDTGLMLSVRK